MLGLVGEVEVGIGLEGSWVALTFSSVLNHSTLEFRDFSKMAPGS